jgi:hypothetical protein
MNLTTHNSQLQPEYHPDRWYEEKQRKNNVKVCGDAEFLWRDENHCELF